MSNPYEQFTVSRSPDTSSEGNPYEAFAHAPVVDEKQQDLIARVNNPTKPTPSFFGLTEIPEQLGSGFEANLRASFKDMMAGQSVKLGEYLPEMVAKVPPLPDEATAPEKARSSAAREYIGGLSSSLVDAGNRLYEENKANIAKLGLTRSESMLGGTAYDVGGAFGSMLPTVGATIITRNPTYAAAYYWALQDSETYKEARAAGKTPEEARMLSATTATGSAIIEAIGGKFLLGAALESPFVKKVLIRAAGQGAEEAAQTAVEETTLNLSGVRLKTWEEQVASIAYAGFIGVVAGAPVSAIATKMEEVAKREEVPDAKAKEIIDNFIKNKEQVADAAATLINNDAENLARDPDAATKMQEAIASVQEQDVFTEENAAATLEAKPETGLYNDVDDKIATMDSNVRKLRLDSLNRKMEAAIITPKEMYEREALSAMSQPKAVSAQVQEPTGMPILGWIKKNGGVKAGSPLAGELKAMGITPKTRPGLFRKNGKFGALDNIPAEEFNSRHGMVAQADETGNYVAEAFMLEEIRKEYSGEGRGSDTQADRELMVDDEIKAIANEMGAIFGPKSIAEIKAIMAENDFDAELAVERYVERKAIQDEAPLKVEDSSVNFEAQDMNDPRFSGELDRATGRLTRKETFQAILDADRAKGSKMVEKVKENVADLGRMASAVFTPISTRLKTISPVLRARLRRFEFERNKQINDDQLVAKPFLEKYAALKREDRVILDFAMRNGDAVTISEIAKANNMEAEIAAVRVVLDGLYKRAKSVGLDVGYRKNFFPRYVAKPEAMLKYFESTEAWSDISEAIRLKEREIGRMLDPSEKAFLVNTLIRGYDVEQITLARPGVLKQRSIDTVTPDINNFYGSTDQAIIRYITSVNDAVETRKFFGLKRTPSDKTDERLAELEADLKKVKDAMEAEQNPEFKDWLGKEKNKINKEIDKLVVDGEKVFVETKNVEDSIGYFLLQELEKGSIKPSDAQELAKIMKARFARGQMSSFWRVYKNVGYIDTMGSTISAVTQLGDLAFAFYKSGVYRTLSVLPRAIAGRSEITRHDIGIEQIAQEFEGESTSANAVKLVFKVVGLEKMDSIGKETLINSALKRYRSQAKKPTAEFRSALEMIFGEETDSVIEDLRSRTNSENVKLLLFNELLDLQPVALSEMPEAYLRMGNGRVFYMLKTFTIKQFDVYRNEIFNDMKTNPVRSLKNLTRLLTFFVMMNAGADFLKDLLLNRETEWDEAMVNNIARVFGLSKYNVYTARREGVGTAAFKTIAPPFKLIDSVYKDSAKAIESGEMDVDDLESVASVPVVGKFYYWWFGAGEDK
jgi:hypothetical protein